MHAGVMEYRPAQWNLITSRGREVISRLTAWPGLWFWPLDLLLFAWLFARESTHVNIIIFFRFNVLHKTTNNKFVTHIQYMCTVCYIDGLGRNQ